MIVLGIDPGTASTGYGVVQSAGSRLHALAEGVIQTRAGVAAERRLAEIHARVGELIETHGPDAVAIEELYFGSNVRTAFAVGQARGVVLLAAGQRGVPSRSYTPQAVKAAVCGHGGAGKEQVSRMVDPAPWNVHASVARPCGGRARGGDLRPQPRPSCRRRWRRPHDDRADLRRRLPSGGPITS